jgi:phage head maturation protease
MSFGFTVSRDRYDEETGTDGRQYIVRTIEGIRKVYDVSAVSIPANDGTSISIRNLADGVIERVKAERLEAERIALEQKRLEVRAKAIKSGGNK